MKKAYYLITPLAVLAVAVLGSLATSSGMDWYNTLELPKNAPPGSFIGMVWTTIFVLSTIAIVLFFNTKKVGKDKKKRDYVYIFIINGVANILWSVFFFTLHSTVAGIIGIVAIETLNLLIQITFWKNNKASFVLWIPYTIWVIIAGYLNVMIWLLNK
jgi:tryptophan-rich sensory protein